MFPTTISSIAAVWLLASATITAELIKVTDFGKNPSNAGMHIYLPAKKAEKPAIVVALHGGMGSGPGYTRETKWTQFSDQRGFLVILPSGANMTDGKCWDVGTKASLTNGPGAGGDTLAIVNMVKFAITKYNADPKKVFVTGSSSGAMMTMTIAAVYPDVFAGGAAYSGLPSGCLAGSPGFGPFTADPMCANGKKNLSPTEWGTRARSYAPSYKAAYPRMQIWHGTSDFVVKYPNLAEGLKQWSNLHGVSFTKNSTETPGRGYTQLVYGDGTKLVGYSGQGVGHTVPVHEADSLKFWGL